MLTEFLPPALIWRYAMSNFGGDGIHSGIGDGADRNAVGKDIQQMSVHFDRASNWDEERENLTTLQRIRDLETYIYGDRRGLITGVLRQMRSHVLWLIILSVLQSVTVILLALLVLRIWGAAL